MERKLKLWVKLYLIYEAIFVPLALVVAKDLWIAFFGILWVSLFAFGCFALIGEILRRIKKPIQQTPTEQPQDFSAAFALFDKQEVKQ